MESKDYLLLKKGIYLTVFWEGEGGGGNLIRKLRGFLHIAPRYVRMFVCVRVGVCVRCGFPSMDVYVEVRLCIGWCEGVRE